MKLFISADIEGCAGTTLNYETHKDEPAYQKYAKQMTDEVVAVCEAALAAGVDEIVVKDGHGDATNIDVMAMPEHVTLIRGKSGHPINMMYGLDETFDAVFYIGYHAPAGDPGSPLSHTSTGASNFIELNGKRMLLDNLLLVDIYNRAKKLHIETNVRRVVFLIETKQEKDINALETVRSLFATKTKDFITAVDEKNIILVKEVKPNEDYADLEKTASVILDMLSSEAMTKVRVAYGTVVNDIKEVSRSYKEAKMALDVGKIFYNGKNVVAYGTLGIGRLIYQLPLPLCRMFIREIFDGKSPDEFDEETLTTINKFFENSLNVSETSRQLYIHRNTLVYRLDKLQKSTGLDLRVFEDAITFKIALMVVKYMKYMENLDY